MAKEDELGTAVDLRRKEAFVPAATLCNVRRDQRDDHADYSVFRLNDMKDMACVLGDVMMLGAHRRNFYFGSQFSLWYLALDSDKKEERAITREDAGESGSEREAS